MDVTEARSVVPVLTWRTSTASTNDDLIAALATDAGLPEFSTVVTDNQTGGRGRMGRSWVAPPGRCLAISAVIRPPSGRAGEKGRGWIPLLAGVAVARALRAELSRAGIAEDLVTVKWPNDVRINGAKVSGILCEIEPRTGAVVIGTGINIDLAADELPVATATSLSLSGVERPDGGQVLADYLRQLTALAGELRAAGYEPERSGLRTAVLAVMDTIGSRVRAELPGGSTLIGTATGLGDDGRLLVDDGDRVTAVGAGDVTHLRY